MFLVAANKNSANYSQHICRSNHISFSILCVLCLGRVSLIFQFCFTAISLQIWTCDFYVFSIYYTADFKHKFLNFWDDNSFLFWINMKEFFFNYNIFRNFVLLSRWLWSSLVYQLLLSDARWRQNIGCFSTKKIP